MITFSQRLQKFLISKKPTTIQTLVENFAEKSFAILFLLLLAVPALPLPTGGVTHVFEIIAMVLAVELIVGRETVWLPKRWLRKPLPRSIQTSALPRFIKIIKWIEKYSRPRLSSIQANTLYIRLAGTLILLFTAFAFLAPPFSGLDTMPALGVVFLSLAMIFEDILLTIVGLVIGGIGIGLILLLSRLALRLF